MEVVFDLGLKGRVSVKQMKIGEENKVFKCMKLLKCLAFLWDKKKSLGCQERNWTDVLVVY